MKKLLFQVVCLVALAAMVGAIRQVSWNGISWRGRWPASSTSTLDAYRMMAKPGDPPFVDLAEVISLERGDRAAFLDARTNKEYSEGHLPNARNLPYYELDKYQESALKGLSANSLLVVYCEGVGCDLSFLLGRELQKAGYKNLRIFYGGFPEWKNAGFPVQQ